MNTRPVVDTIADAVAVGGEAALIKFFVDGLGTQWRDDLIGYHPATDRVVQQVDMPFGGADIAILHGDGSTTLIEARDGSEGHRHVAGGIGHVTLVAAELGLARGGQTIRRALLWSSTGDGAADLTVETACELAGVISLPWPTMQRLLSETSAAIGAAVVIAAAAEPK